MGSKLMAIPYRQEMPARCVSLPEEPCKKMISMSEEEDDEGLLYLAETLVKLTKILGAIN